ncbi:MAG: RHS repeat-associated core domain-containing protein [Chloroflexota bacterium]
MATATDGSSLGSIRFFPFGSTRSGSVPTDKKFTGQRLDGTGLYFYGARYYDPVIGRFISADTVVESAPMPLGKSIYDLAVSHDSLRSSRSIRFADINTEDNLYLLNWFSPQAHNRYGYVLNNPMKYNDPSGHQAIALEAVALLALVAYAAACYVCVYVLPPILTELRANIQRSQSHSSRGSSKSESDTKGTPNLKPPGWEPNQKRNELLGRATNERVKDAIDQLYRPNAKIGDGGTADIIRQEGTHIQKGFDRLAQLKDILRTEKLDPNDLKVVKELIDDLEDALRGWGYDI